MPPASSAVPIPDALEWANFSISPMALLNPAVSDFRLSVARLAVPIAANARASATSHEQVGRARLQIWSDGADSYWHCIGARIPRTCSRALERLERRAPRPPGIVPKRHRFMGLPRAARVPAVEGRGNRGAPRGCRLRGGRHPMLPTWFIFSNTTNASAPTCVAEMRYLLDRDEGRKSPLALAADITTKRADGRRSRLSAGDRGSS